MREASGSSSCRYRTLAKNGQVHIQSCGPCGRVSVHLGGVTLRFEPDALESLWNTLGEALIELHAQSVRETVAAMGSRSIGRA